MKDVEIEKKMQGAWGMGPWDKEHKGDWMKMEIYRNI